jgi:hypothetical protein
LARFYLLDTLLIIVILSEYLLGRFYLLDTLLIIDVLPQYLLGRFYLLDTHLFSRPLVASRRHPIGISFILGFSGWCYFLVSYLNF